MSSFLHFFFNFLIDFIIFDININLKSNSLHARFMFKKIIYLCICASCSFKIKKKESFNPKYFPLNAGDEVTQDESAFFSMKQVKCM